MFVKWSKFVEGMEKVPTKMFWLEKVLMEKVLKKMSKLEKCLIEKVSDWKRI